MCMQICLRDTQYSLYCGKDQIPHNRFIFYTRKGTGNTVHSISNQNMKINDQICVNPLKKK